MALIEDQRHFYAIENYLISTHPTLPPAFPVG